MKTWLFFSGDVSFLVEILKREVQAAHCLSDLEATSF